MSIPERVPYVFATSASESSTTSTTLSDVSIKSKRRRVPSLTNTRPSFSSRTLLMAPRSSVESADAVEMRRIGGPIVGAGLCVVSALRAESACAPATVDARSAAPIATAR